MQSRDGGVTLNPDEEVQERLRLVFTKFRELRSAKAVMRVDAGRNPKLFADVSSDGQPALRHSGLSR